MIHFLSHVAGSEVNDSRPIGFRALGFERPLGLCPAFRLDDPLILIHKPFFFYFFFLFFDFFYCFCIFVFKLGLDGNPLFV